MRTKRKIEADQIEVNDHFKTHTRKFLVAGWKPNTREDLISLLQEVQIGYISCKTAADILLSKLNG